MASTATWNKFIFVIEGGEKVAYIERMRVMRYCTEDVAVSYD
ncbi:hypothetical protein NHE_0866 [Neorickettsia helminthoeca str. Oregon]|uniref:Uncharacterized protein n=1 Tax=Neorickettsia helminthoeca str. Oregon TaxID=1286528 RepID=X5HMR8_9RICK|nr:hypothetical protein NHE_0866 [Neorickettsia helminthoeca str. Oregon]